MTLSFEEEAGTIWALFKSPVWIIWLAQVIWGDFSNTNVGRFFLVAVCLAACIIFSSVFICCFVNANNVYNVEKRSL